MPKRALVLAGGGAKGAYQMGVWKALRELGMTWDLVVGTSIGALNGAMIVMGDFERANALWDRIEYKHVFGESSSQVDEITTALDMVKFAFSDLLLEGSFDTTLLEALIVEFIDEEGIRQSPVDFGLMTVSIPALKLHPLMKKDIPQGQLAAYLMASSSCFPVFRPKVIDGVRYIDGGYGDNLPINMALSQGAEEIIAVDLDSIGFVREPKEDTNSAITIIRPHWNLGAVFAFDKNLFARNRILGYDDAMKRYGHLEGMYYTFKKGEQQKNFKRLQKDLPEAILRINQMLQRPVAKAMQTMDRRSALGFLSRGNWEENGAQMLCRVAELAGMTFNLSPEVTYSFERFHNRLLKEYSKRGGLLYFTEQVSGDITKILALVARAVDHRQITAEIVKLMMQEATTSEALWTLAELLPREFIAAVYLKLLIKAQGLQPIIS